MLMENWKGNPRVRLARAFSVVCVVVLGSYLLPASSAGANTPIVWSARLEVDDKSWAREPGTVYPDAEVVAKIEVSTDQHYDVTVFAAPTESGSKEAVASGALESNAPDLTIRLN